MIKLQWKDINYAVISKDSTKGVNINKGIILKIPKITNIDQLSNDYDKNQVFLNNSIKIISKI